MIVESQQRNEDEMHNTVNPKFTYDFENLTAIYNGKVMDLNSKAEEVKSDVNLFLEYMNGFDKFYGTSKAGKTTFIKTLGVIKISHAGDC